MTDQNSLLKKLRSFTTTELCDASEHVQVMDPGIRQFTGTSPAAGHAVTVDVPAGESAIVSEAIALLKPGDILVISGKGELSRSCWGDYRSFCASFQHAEAVIIDGAFRDIDECEKIGFPVFARGITCRAGRKDGTGQLNVPVICGGIIISSGDIVIGDRNGIIVISEDEAEDVMRKALDKREREAYAVRQMEETGILIPSIPKSIN